jgi:hypothetical protein
MTEQLEDRLREVFLEDASHAPDAPTLYDAAVGAGHRARTIRISLATAATVAAVAATVVLAILLPSSDNGATRHNVAPAPSARVSVSSSSHGALPNGGTASCASDYTPQTLAQMPFAFDGVVASIGPARTNRGSGDLPLVSVTFSVQRWFRGGNEPTVTIDIDPPRAAREDGPPTYRVGTRLLVSGVPRWGGAPLENAIAWRCGFTRYYDPATAEQWQRIFK